MKEDFPFGIDPSGQVPDTTKPVTIIVEPSDDFCGGQMTFHQPFESIPVLVAHVKLFYSPLLSYRSAVICNDPKSTSRQITVTNWIPKTRVLNVKIEKGTLRVSETRY